MNNLINQPAVIPLQASGWFQNALFKDAPGWQSVLIMYAFRAGRSKQLRYQVCSMADLPPCKARLTVTLHAAELCFEPLLCQIMLM